ncbi:MAG: c-type cytochrome, partial [Planctomycetota bacterium]
LAIAEYLKTVPPVREHVLSPEAVRGGELYYSKGCVSCHGPDGKGPRADLTKLGREGDAARIASWIRDPAAVKPGTDMPKLGIDDPKELDAIARFVIEVSKR